MKIFKGLNNKGGTPILLPDTKKLWIASFVLRSVFWLMAIFLWVNGRIDEVVLFYFDPMRVAMDPVVVVAMWLTSCGMAAITVLFVAYLLASKKIKSLDAPLIVYFYTICSFGLSGIAGDLLKGSSCTTKTSNHLRQ
jgi:hypothetical protein